MRRLREVRNKHRVKKLRGWLNKQFCIVKISCITDDGFCIQNEGKDFYISREQYPWFLDASEQEIRDVVKICRMGHQRDPAAVLSWELLDFVLPMEHVKYPDTLKVFGVYIRKQDREDLYKQHVQWLGENNLPIPPRRIQ